jgi:YebC/PmpR family DNA-binding regulatory protein
MAGHSKWSKVKHIKGPLDQKRGQLFSKLAKEITVASKMGGGDPGGNPRLRSAILSARAQSMPNDNIERAIRRGTGEGVEAANYEELVYEAYAPGGVALIIEAATDNKNRTAADLRLIFSKYQGSLASPGAVSYMFHRKGQILIPVQSVPESRLLECVIDAGGEELTSDEEFHVVMTAADRLYAMAEALKSAGIHAESQKLTFVPEIHVSVTDERVAAQVLRLIQALEDNDDVQNVHSNFDAPKELLTKVG